MYSGENLLLREVRFSQNLQWDADHRRLCFFFIVKGRGSYQDGNTSLPLAARDVVLLGRSRGGKMWPADKKELSGYRFLLSLEQLNALLGVGEIGLVEKVVQRLQEARHHPAPSAVSCQCHALLKETPAPHTLEHRSHLLRIAAALLSEEFRLARLQVASPHFSNADLLARLSLADVQTLSAEQLAAKLGYSRRHLNRLFHEQLGASFSDLKMEARLLKSLHLLQDESAKVIDIAMECGFNHLGLFSQFFKRRFGVSPNQWRQQETGRSQRKGLSERCHRQCTLRSEGMCLWGNLPEDRKDHTGNGHRARPGPDASGGQQEQAE